MGTPNHPNWLMFSRASEDTYDFPRVVAYINIRLKSFCFSLLKYLKDTEVNIHNVLIMIENFNIYDSLWDPLFPHHSHISNNLFILANIFNLELSHPIDQVPTRYSDNCQESNPVIDLMFLWSSSTELDNYLIYPKWRLMSNHTLLTIAIPVRHGSHRGGSLQNGLRDEQTCGMTLASAYVLRCLSAAWSQLQMKERKSEWE